MTNFVDRTSALLGNIPPRVVTVGRLLFAAAALVFVLSLIDWTKLGHQSAGLVLPIFGGVCFVLLFVPLLALRWSLLVQIGSTGKLGFLSALRGNFLGLFFNLALPAPVGGDLVRIHFASGRAKIGYARSSLIVLTERLFGLLSLCLFAALGVTLNDRLSQFTTMPAMSMIVGIVGVSAILIAGIAFVQRYISIPLGWIPVLLAFSMVWQSVDFLLVRSYGKFLSTDIPLETLLIVMPLVFIASIFPLAPGGHGAREATLTGLLALTGIPLAQAALIALMVFATKVGVGLVCSCAFIGAPTRLRELVSFRSELRLEPEGH